MRGVATASSTLRTWQFLSVSPTTILEEATPSSASTSRLLEKVFIIGVFIIWRPCGKAHAPAFRLQVHKRSLRPCTVHLPNFVSPYLTGQPCMCVYSHSSKVMLFSTGGGFSKTHRFGFTAHSGSSCDSVSLPLSAIHDPFTDTVFSVAIVHQDQPPFDLGPHSSASLIISALKGIATWN